MCGIRFGNIKCKVPANTKVELFSQLDVKKRLKKVLKQFGFTFVEVL